MLIEQNLKPHLTVLSDLLRKFRKDVILETLERCPVRKAVSKPIGLSSLLMKDLIKTTLFINLQIGARILLSS